MYQKSSICSIYMWAIRVFILAVLYYLHQYSVFLLSEQRIIFELFSLNFRASGNTLVPVGNTGLYRSSKQFVGNEVKDVLIFKFTSPLIYANQER